MISSECIYQIIFRNRFKSHQGITSKVIVEECYEMIQNIIFIWMLCFILKFIVHANVLETNWFLFSKVKGVGI